MFFIGVFGIADKEKEIKIIRNFQCKDCSNSNEARLIKHFTYFHFFFIPIIKWNESYYVICSSCNAIYSIDKYKGKYVEKDDNIDITYWDLKEMNKLYDDYIKRCSNCNKDVERGFNYCPYCGEKVI